MTNYSRAGFLHLGLSGIAAGAELAMFPERVLGQAALVYDPTVFDATMQVLISNSTNNQVALANDLNTLRLAEGMIFDHESFITAAWPLITSNLQSMMKTWGNVGLLNLAAKDTLNALSAQYPTSITGSRSLATVLGSLQRQGVDQISQWLEVLRADHALATQEMHRAANNANDGANLQTTTDVAKHQLAVSAAMVNIAGAQETDMQAMNSHMQQFIVQSQAQVETEQQSNAASESMVYSSFGHGKLKLPPGLQPPAPGTPTVNLRALPHVSIERAQEATRSALSVPILSMPASSVIK